MMPYQAFSTCDIFSKQWGTMSTTTSYIKTIRAASHSKRMEGHQV
eukprot:CCRYP_011833-RA/>CCRYP_011833-RA protein AED:0.49 eAED:0.49 QI:0/-1/0/1/-1/0/1/0/44